MSKPKIIKDYDKIPQEIKERLRSLYPYGFDKKLITFTNLKGKLVSALPYEAEDFNYLIRMTRAEAQEIHQAEQNYQEQAALLHTARMKSASKLSKEITKTLKTLGLPDGEFNISINYLGKQKPQRNGLDDISFHVTTNPGMPASPIGKVASGGELSRISLAIQVVTTQSNTTPTLVFDEVDAGIGGGVAETVGVCLREIANDRQVLCVTHLPQVAAQGHHHLFVSKQKESEQTKTKIESLNPTDRIHEVARMLGGIDLSDKTLAHAKEMVEKAI